MKEKNLRFIFTRETMLSLTSDMGFISRKPLVLGISSKHQTKGMCLELINKQKIYLPFYLLNVSC